MKQAKLAAAIKKSCFHVKEVEYLGYIISDKGISMSPDKVEKIRNWQLAPEGQKPTSAKPIREFIGFAQFYRRFIEGFSKIAKPLTDLTKDKPFVWTEKCQEAFEELKRRFCTAPILEHFQPDRSTVLETDASDFALGCVLSQIAADKKLHPVAFHSRKFNSAEENYDIHDKEMLAIVTAFKEWEHLLKSVDSQIIVYTDHKNLEYFNTTKVLTRRQARWAEHLAEFDFKVVYRPGEKNTKADILSRRWDYAPEGGSKASEALNRDFFKPGQLVIGASKAQSQPLLIKKLSDKAHVPTKGSASAAGYDLYASQQTIIPAQGKALIETDIAMTVPEGTYGRIAPRSGLASKNFIDVGAGVIDADYRGHVKVLLFNHAKTDFEVKEGDRIAQLILERIDTPAIVETQELGESARGERGFGSTGLATAASSRAIISSASIAALRRTAKVQSLTESFEEKLKNAARADDGYQKLRSKVERKQEGIPKELTIDEQGLLYYNGRWVIPDSREIKMEIMNECHDSKVAGHFGMTKTEERVMQNFYWTRMEEDVRDYVRSCDTCQRDKTHRHKTFGLLQPLDVPYRPWESISMDFIVDLPNDQDHTQVWVIVDRFTKYAHFIPLKTHTSNPTKELAKAFAKEIWRLHGLPIEIVSDRDSRFTSHFWAELMDHLGVKLKMSTAFHPQTDGQTERVNGILEGYLRHYCSFQQDNWVELLPLAEYAYNSAYNEALKMSPHMANYGFEPQTQWIKPSKPGDWTNPASEILVSRWKGVWEKARTTLEATRQRMIKWHDLKAQEGPVFKPGDKVMVDSRNMSTQRPTKKLDHKLRGPWRVVKKVGSRAYELALPPNIKVHPVFHISLLEPYRESKYPGRSQPPPEPEVIEGELEYVVDSVVKSRYNGTKKCVEYLVKWKGFPPEEATYEP